MKRVDIFSVIGGVLIIAGVGVIVHEGIVSDGIKTGSEAVVEESVVWTSEPLIADTMPYATEYPVEVLTSNQKAKKVKVYKNVLSIPSIDIKAYIYDNTDSDSLAYGVGRYAGTAKVGSKGNCVVAGHSSQVYNCVLNGVDKLNVLDKILVYDARGKLHKYYVTGMFIVKPTDLSVLETRDESKSQFTIVTCTESGTRRLVIESVELSDTELKEYRSIYYTDRYSDVSSAIKGLNEGVSDYLEVVSPFKEALSFVNTDRNLIIRGYSDDVSENQGGCSNGEAVVYGEGIDEVCLKLRSGNDNIRLRSKHGDS